MNMSRSTVELLPAELVDAIDPEEPAWAEVLPDEQAIETPKRAWPWRVLAALDRAWNWLFGVAALVAMLAIVATIPIVQLLSLGYLLEVSARVAKTGKLRHGFVGVQKAARLGSIMLGVWVLLLVPRFCSSMWHSAWLLDTQSRATTGWRIALFICTAWVVLHAAAAVARGGRLRHFLWPRPIRFIRNLFQKDAYAILRDAVWDFTMSLRLPYYFRQGLQGFLGGLAWLVLPISLLAIAKTAPLLGFLGGALLIFVLLYLPFIQTQAAISGSWSDLFAWNKVRQTIARAPIATAASLIVLFTLALPLYLLKIELIPREAAWLPSLLFVASIWPARLAVGWAMGRGLRRELPRHGLFRWSSRLALLPLVGFYVLLVYFTQYLSWYGVWSLYEQHALLLPVPFLGG